MGGQGQQDVPDHPETRLVPLELAQRRGARRADTTTQLTMQERISQSCPGCHTNPEIEHPNRFLPKTVVYNGKSYTFTHGAPRSIGQHIYMTDGEPTWDLKLCLGSRSNPNVHWTLCETTRVFLPD